MEERRVGRVVNFFRRPMAAAVLVEQGSLAVGDVLHVRGRVTDLYLRVDSLEVGRRPVSSVRAGQIAGVGLPHRVSRKDAVYVVKEGEHGQR